MKLLYNYKFKILTLITLLVYISINAYSQCDTIPIDRNTWSILDFDSQETVGEGNNNGRAIHSIDGDINTFWHTKWKDTVSVYPHHISIDMGQEFPINGIYLVSRNDSKNNKPKKYEFYLSNDGINWGQMQSGGDFLYPNINAPGDTSKIYFGAVSARYFRIVFLSNYSNDAHIAISEIGASMISGGSNCQPTGQNNQVLIFDEIPMHFTSDEPFELSANTNSGLPIVFQVISGPATVSGNTVTLTGVGGFVKIKAIQEGNSQFYSAEIVREFEVVDISAVKPTIFTNLTDELPLLMPELMSYPLYAYATIEYDDQLIVEKIEFFVDNQLIETHNYSGLFQAKWLPQRYGVHVLKIVATASNGTKEEVIKNIEVSQSIENQTVQTLKDAVIDLGTIGSQWYYGTYKLPQSVGSYSSIIANFIVTCPNVSGGCDDWDRLAYVQIKNHRGQWVELFRYITPFGKGCSHSIDVTDYESLLQGEVEFRVYIETWGTGGWKMDLFLDYKKGVPFFRYSMVDEIWHGNYSFGDPANLQSIPAKYFKPYKNSELQMLRIVTTGHNWGQNNSLNAAEFYYSNNYFEVNDYKVYEQYLLTDCNPNPDNCTGQFGTWQYDRAGWCPGTIPKPYLYDMTEYISVDSFKFEYILDPEYVDLCHPNNPNCNSGTTCPDCNDGYNPYYRIGAYMINYSNNFIYSNSENIQEVYKNISIEVLPNPNNGIFRVQLNQEINDFVMVIYDIQGKVYKSFNFKNRNELINKTFDVSDLNVGMYFVKIYNTKNQSVAKFIIN